MIRLDAAAAAAAAGEDASVAKKKVERCWLRGKEVHRGLPKPTVRSDGAGDRSGARQGTRSAVEAGGVRRWRADELATVTANSEVR